MEKLGERSEGVDRPEEAKLEHWQELEKEKQARQTQGVRELEVVPQLWPTPASLQNDVLYYTKEFNDDPKHARSNVTHALKIFYTARDILFIQYGEVLTLQDFEDCYRASYCKAMARKKITKMYNGRPNRMPFFFHDLEANFKFTDEEMIYLRSDDPLSLSDIDQYFSVADSGSAEA